MPQALPALVAWAATAAGATAFVSTALMVGTSYLVGSHQQRKAERQQRDAYNAAQVDRLANISTTVAPRDLVLGRVRKGGAIYYVATEGAARDRLVFHLALAGHEIDAVEQIYLNDEPVTLDADGYCTTEPYIKYTKVSRQATLHVGELSVTLPDTPVSGSVTAVYKVPDDYQGFTTPVPVAFTVSGNVVTLASPVPASTFGTAIVAVSYQTIQTDRYVRIWWELGADNAEADPRTRDLFPGEWTVNHRARGVAKLVCELIYSDTAFPKGPPVVTAVVRGAKVYDPRTGLTQWSQNPALLARHVYTHPYFGKATCSAEEDARFTTAANACDTTHDYVVDGVTYTDPLYRAALVAQYGTPARSILDDLCAAMGGMWALPGGEIYIRAGVYTAPVTTLTDDDLAVIQREGDREAQDDISIAPHRERNEKFNVANVRIWDAGQDFKEVALTPLKSSALITRDGGELSKDIQLSAVFYAPQALHVGGVMMRDARDPLTVEAPFKMKAWALELFDTIALTLPRYGWTDKEFMILGRVWDRQKGVIRLTLKETAAEIFTPDGTFDPQGYADNSNLPRPWEIEPPGTLSITSGTSELMIGADGTVVTRVRVVWPAITDPSISVGGQVEVQWREVTAAEWTSILVDGDVSQTYINGVSDGVAILVQARTRNTIATSDWGLQQLHVVLGKTEPPSLPTGVSATQELVFFRLPADLDIAGVRVRSVPGQVTAPVFSRGADVIDGLQRTSPARIERRLYGVQTIMVVSEDTSGNQSEPAIAVLDFGAPDVNSSVWDRVYADESFPGTYTDCSLSGGAVVADTAAASDVYLLDNLYGEPDVYATQYDAMTWQAAMAVPPYAGSLVLTSTLAGNSPLVEYRIAGDVITDLYASSDVYAEADLYGAAGEWTLWPGALQVSRGTPVDLRVSIASSAERGQVSEFTLSLILDKKEQTFTNITVDAAGTRLAPSAGSPARNWVGSLLAVYGWPAVDGSGAIAGRALDFSPTLGPLVQFVNIAGDPVTGKGTVKVEGYSDD